MVEPKFFKYPEIPYLTSHGELAERDIYLFEKLDGSNCQIRQLNWRVFPGRRSGFLNDRIWDSPGGKKSWMGDFKRWALSNPSLLSIPPEMIVYGEWLHEKPLVPGMPRIEYPEEAKNRFYLIDICLEIGGGLEFMSYDTARSIVDDLKLEGVRPIPFQKCAKPFRLNKDKLGIEGCLSIGSPEGWVIKDYSIAPPFMRKIVSIPYNERNQKEKDIRKRFCTTPRIMKKYEELVDLEGEVRDPKALVERVLQDIMKETGVLADRVYVMNKVNQFLINLL